MLDRLRDAALATLPVLERELVGLLRSRRAFWISVSTAAGAGLVPLLAWPLQGSLAPFLQAYRAFEAYRLALLGADYLFVPAVTAGAIAEERERGTFELLLGSRLHPAGIFLGKLLSAVSFALFLLASTLPMAAVVLLLGGVAWAELWGTFLRLAALTCVLAALGLFNSFLSRWTPQALAMTLFQGALIVLAHPLLEGQGGWLEALCLAAFLALVGAQLRLLRRTRLLDPPAASCGILPVSFARPMPIRHWLENRALARSRRSVPDDWNPVLAATVRDDYAGLARVYDLFYATMTFVLLVAVLVSGFRGSP
ncbi:MAG: ABC transporter permease, partial [Thermoanaerobaculia bacterium]